MCLFLHTCVTVCMHVYVIIVGTCDRNHHSKCFQNEIHIGWLPWSLLLVTAEHGRQSTHHVLVGLWVPDSGDGQSNHAGGQQYLEQQSHSTGKVWSLSLSLFLFVSVCLSVCLSLIALLSSFSFSLTLSLSECCCVCHQGQICKKPTCT